MIYVPTFHLLHIIRGKPAPLGFTTGFIYLSICSFRLAENIC